MPTDARMNCRCYSPQKGGRKSHRPPFFVLLSVFLLVHLGLSVPAAGAQPPASPQQRQAELEQLRQRIGQLQTDIARKQGKRSELGQRLQDSERQIGVLARGLRVLRGRLKRQAERLRALHEQEQSQSLALARERELLAQQIRSAYVTGRQEQFRILLNQRDPAVLTRTLAYYDYLNRERARRMQEIRAQLEELANTRAEIGTQQSRLEKLQQEQEAQKQSLEQEQVARRGVLEALAGELKDQSKQLERLRNDERQLDSLLRGLQDALADVAIRPVEQLPFAKVRGKLQWPVRGRIRHSFGETKIGKLEWDGVMIGAPEGSEVRAVHAGRIAFADWLRGFGLLLIIDHGDGFMTLYGHNQSLFKEAGDWVDAGEPIAAAGNTGGQKKSGVYFAIRRHGKAIDPKQWCRRTKGKSVG